MTLRDRILLHQNAYNKYLKANPSITSSSPLAIGCVVPFYGADQTIRETVLCLKRACDYALEKGAIQQATIYVVVDGCAAPDLCGIASVPQIRIEIKHHFVNRGRAAARNTGLFETSCALTAFVDADVWVDPAAIYHHVAVHSKMQTAGVAAITFGLFETFKVLRHEAAHLTYRDLERATGDIDFRLLCDFKETYACCPEDDAFVGHRFEILRDTDDLNAWPREGWFGPWMLPEICLGGFFMVRTSEARTVGGFDESFDKYGYEETTLVAKLIALKDAKLIPLKSGRNLHIDIMDGPQSRTDKDEMLRKSYLRYHSEFLSQELKNRQGALQ